MCIFFLVGLDSCAKGESETRDQGRMCHVADFTHTCVHFLRPIAVALYCRTPRVPLRFSSAISLFLSFFRQREAEYVVRCCRRTSPAPRLEKRGTGRNGKKTRGRSGCMRDGRTRKKGNKKIAPGCESYLTQAVFSSRFPLFFSPFSCFFLFLTSVSTGPFHPAFSMSRLPPLSFALRSAFHSHTHTPPLRPCLTLPLFPLLNRPLNITAC